MGNSGTSMEKPEYIAQPFNQLTNLQQFKTPLLLVFILTLT